MQHYGFPPKFITIIQQLYENATCQVIHEGKLTEPFFVQTGVRQGCLLSPTIFLIVIDWVMRKTTKDRRMGIQWTLTKQLEDLDFADDISLLAHRHEDAQTKLEHVAEEAEKVGLQININKTEVMRVNNNRQEAIQLQGKEIKEADSFTYLGSVVSKDGGTDEDIRNRINKARHAFNTLRPIWRATSLSLQNKIRIFMVGVQGPSRPRRGPGAGPWWGLKGGNAPFLKTNFAHFEAKTWPLLERKVLNYHITWL